MPCLPKSSPLLFLDFNIYHPQSSPVIYGRVCPHQNRPGGRHLALYGAGGVEFWCGEPVGYYEKLVLPIPKVKLS